jgi:hypothetical protein
VEDFANSAQYVWRELLEKRSDAMLYNGIDPDPSLEKFRAFGRKLFRGHDAKTTLVCD